MSQRALEKMRDSIGSLVHTCTPDGVRCKCWLIGSFERGQAYVELVMVLPLFLMVIAALIFFGRVLYVKIALERATMPAVPRSKRSSRGTASRKV